jgi:hypothetical protein
MSDLYQVPGVYVSSATRIEYDERERWNVYRPFERERPESGAPSIDDDERELAERSSASGRVWHRSLTPAERRTLESRRETVRAVRLANESERIKRVNREARERTIAKWSGVACPDCHHYFGQLAGDRWIWLLEIEHTHRGPVCSKCVSIEEERNSSR